MVRRSFLPRFLGGRNLLRKLDLLLDVFFCEHFFDLEVCDAVAIPLCLGDVVVDQRDGGLDVASDGLDSREAVSRSTKVFLLHAPWSLLESLNDDPSGMVGHTVLFLGIWDRLTEPLHPLLAREVLVTSKVYTAF